MAEPEPDATTNKERIDIKQFIATSIPWFAVCGFAEIGTYYWQFDRNVLAYFSIPDVLPGILPDLVWLCVIIAVNFILMTATLKFTNFVANYNYVANDILEESMNSSKDLKSYFKSLLLYSPHGLAVSSILFFYICSPYQVRSTSNVILCIAAGICTVLITRFYSQVFHAFKFVTLDKVTHVINKTFIALFIISSSIGYLNADAVRLNYYKGTSILVNGKRITSDSTNYYIGKTSSYIIFYSSLRGAATLYPVSEVKEINLQLKKPPVGPSGGTNPPDPIPGDPLPLDPAHPHPANPKKQ